jgi:flagellar basal body P-ring protein FlgI
MHNICVLYLPLKNAFTGFLNMETFYKTMFILLTLSAIFFLSACAPGGGPAPGATDETIPAATIGELTDFVYPSSIAVEGYCLVGGLAGTGSSQCPPDIRRYLEQYILKQLPGQKNISPIIDSPNTAAVYLYGIIPPIPYKNQRFDIKVTALADTQTTSLANGNLLPAELNARGRFGIGAKILASASGPVFIDMLSGTSVDKKTGYILAGGRVLDDYRINMTVKEASFRLTNRIRNRINERFGSNIAHALMAGQLALDVPKKYKGQEQKFIALVKAVTLVDNPQTISDRINKVANELDSSPSKESAEIVLESIGKPAAEKLVSLLNSPNPEVVFRAARCLLNIGDDRGLVPLRNIVLDKTSAFRIEALKAITYGARRNDAAVISIRMLRDEDFNIRLAAYEQLRTIDDVTINKSFIGRNFSLEQITHPKIKDIYVTRSGEPRIVIFGAPIDSDTVTIIRKLPDIPPITLLSSYNLEDIIQTLCEEAFVRENSPVRPGLNVSYSEIIAVVKKMCMNGAIPAEFRAGPLLKID